MHIYHFWKNVTYREEVEEATIPPVQINSNERMSDLSDQLFIHHDVYCINVSSGVDSLIMRDCVTHDYD